MTMWMGWATMVSLLLGTAAYLGERSARDLGRAGRWIWAVALAGAVALQAWALLGPRTEPLSPSAARGPEATRGDYAWLFELRSRTAAVVPEAPAGLDDFLAVGWIVASGVLVIALVGGLVHLRTRAAHWEAIRLHGEDILVSEDFGPALVGVWSPRIVVPRWALALPEPELGLACRHEAEHRSARDTRLLFAAALAVAAFPWNAGIWWMARGLRAATEVDCDDRVLRGGVSRAAYATLLYDIGIRMSRTRIPGLALARPVPLLERRMKMIVRNVSSRRLTRAVPAAFAAVLLAVAACDTSAPTTPANGKLSAAVTESSAEAPSATEDLQALRESGALVRIEGKEVQDLPSDLDAARIERVEVRKAEDGSAPTVDVFLVKQEPESAPAVFVDGVLLRADDAKTAISEIDPDDILRVDVRKEADGDAIYVTLKAEASGGPASSR
jgi:hypothetical protein